MSRRLCLPVNRLAKKNKMLVLALRGFWVCAIISACLTPVKYMLILLPSDRRCAVSRAATGVCNVRKIKTKCNSTSCNVSKGEYASLRCVNYTTARCCLHCLLQSWIVQGWFLVPKRWFLHFYVLACVSTSLVLQQATAKL
jgi:hypothetical protein